MSGSEQVQKHSAWRAKEVVILRGVRDEMKADIEAFVSGGFRLHSNHVDVTDRHLADARRRLGNIEAVIAAFERDVAVGDP